VQAAVFSALQNINASFLILCKISNLHGDWGGGMHKLKKSFWWFDHWGTESSVFAYTKKNGGQTVVLLLACLIQSFLCKCHGLLAGWEGIDKAEMDGKLFLC
jgi:hypothetical protein